MHCWLVFSGSFLSLPLAEGHFLVVLPLVGLWALAMISELHDPFVRPAILRELGRGYVAQAYIAAVIPFLFLWIGVWRKRNEGT